MNAKQKEVEQILLDKVKEECDKQNNMEPDRVLTLVRAYIDFVAGLSLRIEIT